jgi:Uma2 family endonuclease
MIEQRARSHGDPIMSTVAAKPVYTPEDLLTMPDGKNYELVDGEIVERNTGWNSSYVGGRLYHKLSAFCEARPCGAVAPADASYQCFPHAPNKVRRPDVSFIDKKRLPPKHAREGHCRIAPDMATEVVSPNDTYEEVEERVDDFQRAGVRLVWVINPQLRSIRVHRLDGTVTDLSETDELDGEDVIPGFRCPVAELFQEPPSEQTVTTNGPPA